MAWVRLDDKFPHNPKILKAGPLGLAMHVAAICYCNQHLTDGFIPRAAVTALLNLEGIAMRCWDGEMMGGGDDAEWQLIVEDLVASDLWHPVQGGWSIHDYLEYQPSKKKILTERAANAERQSRWRNGVTNEENNAVSNGHVAPAPRKKEEVRRKKEETGSVLRTDAISASLGPIDLKIELWKVGKQYLGKNGVEIKQAGSLLGKWRKTYGDSAVIDALAQAQTCAASEPIAYIESSLRKRGTNGHGKDGPATQLMQAAMEVVDERQRERERKNGGGGDVVVPLLGRN